MRRLPLKRDRSSLLLKLEIVQLERIHAPTEQANRCFMLRDLSRSNPRVDQWFDIIVYPQTRAIRSLNNEFIITSLISPDGTTPLHGKSIRSLKLLVGSASAISEIHLSIHAL